MSKAGIYKIIIVVMVHNWHDFLEYLWCHYYFFPSYHLCSWNLNLMTPLTKTGRKSRLSYSSISTAMKKRTKKAIIVAATFSYSNILNTVTYPTGINLLWLTTTPWLWTPPQNWPMPSPLPWLSMECGLRPPLSKFPQFTNPSPPSSPGYWLLFNCPYMIYILPLPMPPPLPPGFILCPDILQCKFLWQLQRPPVPSTEPQWNSCEPLHFPLH